MMNLPTEGFRLSPQQKHLWLLQRGQSLAYRAQAIIVIEGNLNAKLMKAAIQGVINRYEILRTTFHFFPGLTSPLQVITTSSASSVHEHNLGNLDPREQEASIEALCQAATNKLFHLEHGPLLHISLLTLSPSKYILLIVLPALCADTVGLNNLIRTISRSYVARLHNEECPDGVIQYADIAEWQNEVLEAESGEIGRAFWRKQDIKNQLCVKLPFEDHPSGKSSFKPLALTSEIPQNSVSKIKTLTQKYKTSTSVFLLACFKILLWRVTEGSSVVVGTRCNGRKYKELKEALGLLAKYLPVHCHLKANAKFYEILGQVYESAEQIDEWQECFSWEQMNGSTENDEGPPFFPFCFDFEELPATFSVADVSFSIQQQYICVDRFKVKLSCVQKGDALIIAFHYDSNLFQTDDIQRLSEQFHALLERVIDSPETAISELDILSDAERQKLLVEFNNTKADYPKDVCIHQLIEEQVERTPDNIAVVFEGQKLTYAELNAHANQLAHHLRSLGVGPDVLVGICVERSLEMVVGILGVLKAGGAYVPLDPTYPKERLAFMLEDTQAPVLLTQQRLIGELPEHLAHVLCLDRDWKSIATESKKNPTTEVTSDNLVYVIYTSGSTGKPKGVIITHQDLVISNCARISYFNESIDTFLLLSSLSFDSSVVGIFWTLCQGGTLFLISEDIQQNMIELTEIIAENRISHLLTLPSFYSLILEYSKSQQLSSLRTVIVAGEACPRKLVDHHKALLKSTALFSEYGATETTVFSSVYNCLDQRLTFAPLGHPIANAQMYILDPHLYPMPIGVPGEVYFGGNALAKGYLNRPDLTAERFIPNPFSKESGARLYKSGDLARHLPCGDVEFLGRIDNQVKIRGFRIELEEVEAVLSQYPSVREVVVVAKETSKWQTEINEQDGDGIIGQVNTDDLVKRMLSLGPDKANQLLANIGKLSENEVQRILPDELRADFNTPSIMQGKTPTHLEEGKNILPRHRNFPEFGITLQIKRDKFISPPRQFQKNWLINQALNEFADDLMHLDKVSKRFVAGTEFKYEDHASNITQSNPDNQEIMEDWQIPIMKAMAKVVTETQGDVLEIGFGRGVSATFIQKLGVKSHTIIEFSDNVIKNFYEPWERCYPDKDIKLVHGMWQDVVDGVGVYDGIFFHTYPVTEDEFIKYIVNSITFAEHFFPYAANHLRKGGIFTYLTNEIDSLSRRHQRLIFRYFRSFAISVKPLSVPEDTRDLWGANSMVIIRAMK